MKILCHSEHFLEKKKKNGYHMVQSLVNMVIGKETGQPKSNIVSCVILAECGLALSWR